MLMINKHTSASQDQPFRDPHNSFEILLKNEPQIKLEGAKAQMGQF